MTISIRHITADRIPDFYRVHCTKLDTGWCYCAAWDVPTWEGWQDRTDEQNRAHRDAMFAAGRYDGYLLYSDSNPVGWAQCGPVVDLPKLVKQYSLTPEPGDFALSCITIIPAERAKGLSRRFVEMIVADLKSRRIPRLLAFPFRGRHSWTGPESAFTANGFTLLRDDPKSPVLLRVL